MFKTRKKTISRLVLSFFISTLFTNFSYSNQVALQLQNQTLLISPKIGKITETFSGTGNQEFLIIQDLHLEKTTQQNISKIIQNIDEFYGKRLSSIVLEGAFDEEIKSPFLENLNNQEAKNKIAEYLLNNNELTGPEYFALTNPKKIKLEGLEDKNIYLENFYALYDSLKNYEKLETILSKIDNSIAKSKIYLFPTELIDFEKNLNKKSQNLFSQIEYLKFFSQKYKIDFRIYLQLENYLKLKNIEKNVSKKMIEINIEAENVVKFLKNSKNIDSQDVKTLQSLKKQEHEFYLKLRDILKKNNINISNFSNLNLYFLYLDYFTFVDEIMLLEEKNNLENAIKNKMMKNRSDGKKVMELERYFELMKKYFTTNISSQEVEIWRENKNYTYELLTYLGQNVFANDYFSPNKEAFEIAEKNMSDFYNFAEKRNEIFAKNSTKNLSENSVKVVILGGYHAKGFCNILKSKGISYQLILPVPGTQYDKNIYLNKVKAQYNFLKNNTENTNLNGNTNNSFLQLIPILAQRDFLLRFKINEIENILETIAEYLTADEIETFIKNLDDAYQHKISYDKLTGQIQIENYGAITTASIKPMIIAPFTIIPPLITLVQAPVAITANFFKNLGKSLKFLRIFYLHIRYILTSLRQHLKNNSTL